MKKNIIFKGFLLSILSLSISCEDFLEGTNENPNDPVAVSPGALLAPAELTLAYSYNANLSRWSGIFTQHVKGVARQQSGFNGYNFTASNFDTDWSNMYVDVLQNLDIIIADSQENGYNHYLGAAQTLKAYSLMVMTDYWNSIPYSEALTGVEDLQPAFDSQASIYDEVHSLLASARANFSGTNGALSFGGDLIYGGDVALWSKATHAIDARAYIHQSLLNGVNYTAALSSISQAFASSAEDMTFEFGDAATTAAPWYQFNRDRGDTGFNSTFGDALDAVNDPRRDIYDGDAAIDNFGDVVDTHEYFVIDQAVGLITYTELMFVRAEALLATGGSQADIRAAYLAAIQSSFSSLGLDDDYAAYIAQAAVAPATITLENVMTQKWFASYAEPESFTDWRRTGIPVLVPNNGVSIPRRWLYPQTEIELNSNTPDATLNDRVDWDTN
jgi:hypothetical protein